MFDRNRQPLGNATNMPTGTASVDPAYGNTDMAATGTKRHSGLFNRNRNTLTKPGPGRGYNNGMGTAAGYPAGTQTGYAGAGAGAPGAAAMPGAQVDPATGVAIPSSGAIGNSSAANGAPITPTASNARSLRNSGRLDNFIGTLFCAPRLKSKGIAKEEQAHAMAVQAAELNAAGQLEAEAAARRERAVAQGAHPMHGTLGGLSAGGASAGAGGAGGVGAGSVSNDGAMGAGGVGAGTGANGMGVNGHETATSTSGPAGDPMNAGGAPGSGVNAGSATDAGVDHAYNAGPQGGAAYGPSANRIGLNA